MVGPLISWATLDQGTSGREPQGFPARGALANVGRGRFSSFSKEALDMVIATGDAPRRHSWGRSRRVSREAVRNATDVVLRIDSLPTSDFVRAQFVHALRQVLKKGPQNRPPFAA